MFKLITKGFAYAIVNNIKFLFIKIFHFNHFRYKFSDLISPFASVDIRNNGTIIFGENVKISSGNLLGVRRNGMLSIGNNSYMNRNCQIVCYEKISIGDRVGFGPNVMIFDHDHVFNSNGNVKNKYTTNSIEIGDDCWIGTGVIILKGTKIGHNSIIGAGCVIKGEIPSNSVVVQKRKNTIIKKFK